MRKLFASIVLLSPILLCAQDPEVGKSQLFVTIEPGAALAANGKTFSPELELCQSSGGQFFGRTERGHLVYRVASDEKAKATDDVKKRGKIKVADVKPAGAGKIKEIKRLLVRYKEGERPKDEELNAAGLKIVPQKESKPGRFLVVDAPEGVNAEMVEKLKGIEGVTYAEAERTVSVPQPVKPPGGAFVQPGASNAILAAAAPLLPTKEPFFDKLYGLPLIHVKECWEKGLQSTTIIVAVIDTGVDLTHIEFTGNVWENSKEKAGSDGQDDDGNGYIDDVNGYDFHSSSPKLKDLDGHGTHVAGIIGAAVNGVGVVGVSPKVKIMSLRFMELGEGSNYDAVHCIDYAIANGASIINASWGFYSAVADAEIEAAIERARNKGVLFVAAAGNSGTDNDQSKWWPASSTKDNVISVMAINQDDDCQFSTWSSNFGAMTVHLAAPGDHILSTVPGNTYDYKSGTSMATPHVSSSIALMRSHNDYATANYTTLRKTILEKARLSAKLNGKCTTSAVLDLRFLLQ